MLFSIGYATKDIDTFLHQLAERRVDAIADVRSVPYSTVFYDYHRENLARQLQASGHHYVYLGEELGPRSKDPAHYDDTGQVQFERLQGSTRFQEGVRRLFTGLDKGMTIAMLCAEKDAAVCHRSLLIAHYLLDRHQLDTGHLNHAGEVEMESALQCRLMHEHGIVPDMITPECECLQLARLAQTRRYAYRAK